MRSFKWMLLAVLMLTFSFSTQAENTSEIATVERFVSSEKMLLIHRQSDESLWLVNYEGSCTFKEGSVATLGLYNYLDASRDTIGGSKCNITRSEPVNMTLKVENVSSSGSTAYLLDEQGQMYRLRVDAQQCRIVRYEKDVIYGWRYQAGKWDEYDDLFLPYDPDLNCSVNSITKVVSDEKPNLEDPDFVDISGPSKVTDVNATPGNGQVYLRWKAAIDNVAVDHYLISYSRYRLNPDGPDLNYMPKQINTSDTHYTVKNLENNEDYFFYVLAVDAAGNTSPRWSEEESASTNSAIRNFDQPSSSTGSTGTSSSLAQLKISLSSPTPWIFYFSWNPYQQAVRQTLTLKQKGATENMWVKYQWPYSHLVFLKPAFQKDVVYQLTVKNYSSTDLLEEQTYEFSI